MTRPVGTRVRSQDRIPVARAPVPPLTNGSDPVVDLGILGDASLMAEVIAHLPHAVAVLTDAGTVAAVNAAWLDADAEVDALVGVRVGEDLLSRCHTLPPRQAAVGEHVADGLRRILAGRADRFELQYEIEGPEGSQWSLLTAASLPGGRAILTHTDTTIHHSVQDVLAELAFHDRLTGLPNRSLLLDRIRMALIRAQRSSVFPAVIYLDLDGFKTVNDEHGHDVGDQVLIEVSRRLTSSVREGDTCGRWGGDEFLLVIELTDARAVEGLVERARRAFDAPIEVGDLRLQLGFSIGVVLARGDERVDQLVRRADEAMYEAKRAGDGVRIVHRRREERAG